MQEIHEENSLLACAMRGDEYAFAQLMKDNERLMFSVALSICGHYEDAQDCVQDAMLHIYRGLSGFRGEAPFASWVYCVTVHVCLDEMRRRKRQRRISLEAMIDAGWAPDDDTYAPERILCLSESCAALNRAIEALPANMRIMVILRDVQGRSYKEISDMLHLGEGTVKSRIHRSHAKLLAFISEDMRE